MPDGGLDDVGRRGFGLRDSKTARAPPEPPGSPLAERPVATSEEARVTTHAPYAPGTPCWFDLTTAKPQETQPFYRRLFGWTFEDQGPEYGHDHWVRQAEQVVAGFMPQSPEMPSTWTVYYASDDAQADAAHIRELGGQLMVDPMPVHGLGHMLVARDPTGADFGLWQPLAFGGLPLPTVGGPAALRFAVSSHVAGSGRAGRVPVHLPAR